ncbi:uncharacterized protein MONBRDRAFT_32999 [Monosiga brevicollis MX1]|uniref:Uncharacterized protein n=1 Tax=Monosiga brevicollis TaxID=81824 RepID=A9V2Y6_MONBE|nr:uncharacterized protein MONBRDRAFT_32999 [Monosiga brevicollis MX1]EDQ87965.1 predicted protein [Monosiga brevicollis MX1]|eukprot:XP_001747041.1 hypothetical protein [Monosiga brevicollis MX1]
MPVVGQAWVEAGAALAAEPKRIRSLVVQQMQQRAYETEVEPHAVDLFTHVAAFCARQHYVAEQMAAALALVDQAWTACLSTNLDNFNETLERFETDLINCTVHRPPFSEHIFSLEQAKALLDYVTRTLFAHFHIYKHVCTKLPRLELTLDVQLLDTGVRSSSAALRAAEGKNDREGARGEDATSNSSGDGAAGAVTSAPAVNTDVSQIPAEDVEALLQTDAGQHLKALVEKALREKVNPPSADENEA